MNTWDLTQMFKNDAEWENSLISIKLKYNELASYRGKLKFYLKEFLENDAKLGIELSRIVDYSFLKLSQDNSNSVSLDRDARIELVQQYCNELTDFVVPELMLISDEEWLVFETNLPDWRRVLQLLRSQKPHLLSEPEERILTLSSNINGSANTYSQLMDVDLTFKPIKFNGTKFEITETSYSEYMFHNERGVRKNAYKSYYKGLDQHKFTLASTLISSVKADLFNAKVRKYENSFEQALQSGEIPSSLYTSLIQCVDKALPSLQKYFKHKAKLLNITKLKPYDLKASINIELKYSFEEGTDLVYKSLSILGDEYVNTLKHGISTGWCDVYPVKGKSSGAFSGGSYGYPPYMLLNYTGTADDVFTLTHESGHSMHTWYSNSTQLPQNADYPIFLAEVASIFNEFLLSDYLIKNSTDENKQFFIEKQIQDIISTFFRQIMFAEFELEIHKHEALTLDAMRSIYSKLQNKYLPGVDTSENLYDLEFLRISHFFNSFYVYQYATGLAAALHMSQRVINGENPQFFIDFLKSGNSKPPLETLNIDFNHALNHVVELFSKLVDQFIQ